MNKYHESKLMQQEIKISFMYTQKWRIFDTGQFLSAFIYLNCTGQQCKNLRKAALQSIGQMIFNIDVLASSLNMRCQQKH